MNNVEFLLGEISAKLDALSESDKQQHVKIDYLNERLHSVESKSTLNGLISGATISVAIAFIKHKLGA